jgi:nucleotidyltransferase/DNA polymerase involved in DNA repair
MRTACIYVPFFTVALERQRDPSLARQPVVVHDRQHVLEASLPGVRAGLALRQAKALCPQAAFLEADHIHYRAACDAMLDALERVAPAVEPAGLGCAYADIDGLQGLYADEFALVGALTEAVRDSIGLLPATGIAGGKFVAWVAASSVDPSEAGIVPPEREREFQRDKDVALLPFGPELIERLDLLALRTLGDIAALPQPAVEAQFRSSGRRLWELANGIDREPVRPRKHSELLTELIAFEAPLVASEAMIAAARQIVARLGRRLDGRAARHMRLQLLADGRIVWERQETFREPTGDERRVLLLLKTRLSWIELSQGIDTVVVTLSGIGRDVAKQSKLFTDTQQNLNQIGESIRQLRARYGRDAVGHVMEVNPWSRHPEERTVLVPYDA